MNAIGSPAVLLLARVLMAALFVLSGFGKLTDPGGTIGYIASAGLPVPQAAYAVALAVELGGGLAIVAGLFTPLVALVLAIFTLVAGFAFHRPLSDPNQFIHFWKNVSIAGGFLVLAAHGAGAWSVDGVRARRVR